jgi:tritrans,polycis-undecaprenyl-diphosphate synthase [geranylgeranyl-diphosphate specific]
MGKVPRHIGIIMDGNRRFARALMMKPWMGHEWGAKKVEALFSWCRELGIREVTLYAFSLENFNRPKNEFDYLMAIFRKEFSKLLENDSRVMQEGVRINFIGRLGMFPQDVEHLMRQLIEKTKGNRNYTVNFAMAYGGRAEVVDAARRIAEQVRDGKLDLASINEEVFERNLYFPEDVDMIIRTGGEKRTSNFLPFQAAYSEWIFVDKMWPDFEKEDLMAAIEEFGQRERRFGR